MLFRGAQVLHQTADMIGPIIYKLNGSLFWPSYEGGKKSRKRSNGTSPIVADDVHDVISKQFLYKIAGWYLFCEPEILTSFNAATGQFTSCVTEG